MKTIKDAKDWYESLVSDVRDKLQKEFGNEEIVNREVKFYKWLRDNKC